MCACVRRQACLIEKLLGRRLRCASHTDYLFTVPLWHAILVTELRGDPVMQACDLWVVHPDAPSSPAAFSAVRSPRSAQRR